MGLRTQKYWLEPEKIDAVMDFVLSMIDALPTTDPEIEGALWNDGGVVRVSAGAQGG